MENQKWQITFSHPDWLEKDIVCEATSEELIDMTAQSYEFREMLDGNEVCGGLVMFWENWCEMNEEQEYQGEFLGGPSLTSVPCQKKTLLKKMLQHWEDLLNDQ